MHPNDHRHQDGWRRFEDLLRRGVSNLSGSFPSWEGLEGNFRVGRMLASGDLRLVALYLIEQQPRHGYDLMKAIEEKTAGFYSPSPGVVYPALTYLEEAGYVTSSAEGNKKEYSITAAGRAHLADNRDAVESTLDYLGKIGRRWSEMQDKFAERGERRNERTDDRDRARSGRESADRDIPNVIPEVNEARRALKSAIAEAITGDEERQRRLANILDRAARDIRQVGADPTDDIDV